MAGHGEERGKGDEDCGDRWRYRLEKVDEDRY